jgi:hypothetical protein
MSGLAVVISITGMEGTELTKNTVLTFPHVTVYTFNSDTSHVWTLKHTQPNNFCPLAKSNHQYFHSLKSFISAQTQGFCISD